MILLVQLNIHDQDENKVKAPKLKGVMKEHATATRGKPSQIIADNVVQVPVEVRAALGNLESLKRVIRDKKRGDLPKEPSSLKDLELEEKWTHLLDQEFLIHDTGKDAPARMMVFATQDGIRHLARSSQWFTDGTFGTAPKLFSQLYVIRAPLGNSTVACVCAFMNGKSQNVYEELFTAINNKCELLGFDCDPLRINIDFELAVIKAIKAVFGDHVHIQGCFYHLTQNIWRKIQELGLAPFYRSDSSIKLFCGMIDALAFLPCEQVTDGMEYLHSECPSELVDLLGYFDTTYVSGTYCTIKTPGANNEI